MSAHANTLAETVPIRDYGAQILRLARPGGLTARKALWLMLAYFDESYDSSWNVTPSASDIFTVAGFVASEEDWNRFRKLWKHTKGRYGLDARPFHATDCENGYGAFKGWSQPKR